MVFIKKNLKKNKLFGYSTGYDITMKKALTPQLCLPKSIREDVT